jgi:candicidin polyketide synthase FscB
VAADEEARSSPSAQRDMSSWYRRRRTASAVDSWLYRTTWTRVTCGAKWVPPGRWLVVLPADVPEDDWTNGILDGLARLGLLTERLALSGSDDPTVAAERVSDAMTKPTSGVLSLLAVDEVPHPEHPVIPRGLAGTLHLLLALEAAGAEVPLWCLTRGAVSAPRLETLTSPGQAMIWGLGRGVALEAPRSWGGLVDLPAVVDRPMVSWLAHVLDHGCEDQVAVRPDGMFARRLTRAVLNPSVNDWTARGTVLVTGGTGALGARTARWLAGRGAEHLVLISRQGPAAPGAVELRHELEAMGARVTFAACDAADRVALERVLAQIPAEAPLTGVVHAASVLDDGVLSSLTLPRFETVILPKVAAAINLDELTRGHDLAMFVLFSSVSSSLGNAGQANYAAANAFLDALAERRRADGLVATSLSWGPWAGAGLAVGNAGLGERMRGNGMTPMAPEAAIAALQRAVAADATHLTVTNLNWESYAAAQTPIRLSPLISDLPEIQRALAVRRMRSAGALSDRLRGLTPAEQDRLLLDVVRAEIAGILGLAAPDAVEANRPFQELGFDSLAALEVRIRLMAVTGARLSATLLVDYPSTAAVAGHLRACLLGDPGTLATVAPPSPSFADHEIAIVAMACRFPGGVASPEDLWDLLARRGDAVGAVPADRGWDTDAVCDPERGQEGTTYAHEAGFLTEAAEFDAGFFGISPREAVAMDPQQRLLLETAWEAVERARIDPASLRGTDVGVFAGAMHPAYAAGPVSGSGRAEGLLGLGAAGSEISGGVSFLLGLEGPAVSVDAACSSSLVALHLAMQSLRGGECSLALAGGVTVMAVPGPFVELSRLGALAGDGRCKAYAEGADGLGLGEGVGVLALERLSDARRGGHPVLAVLRGSAVNQNGAPGGPGAAGGLTGVSGLTAPNGLSQQRVIRRALAVSGLGAADVDVVEGHGMGTAAGDRVEVQALIATYGQDRPPGRPLLLGSVKSNLGHAQAAAGVAGVIKMVLAMAHGVVPATLHVDAPSSRVDWLAGSVGLVTEAVPWPQEGRPRRAGVSSFGFSGTNAHVIVEQPPTGAASPPASRGGLEGTAPPGPTPWVVSARSAAGVADQARRLAAHVRAAGGGARAVDVGYSLAVTRSAMGSRAGVVARDAEGFLAGLDALAAGQEAPGVVRGTAEAPGTPGAVFVFPGQGAQWAGMATGLLETSPVFARQLAACAAALAPHVGWSLLDVLGEVPGAPPLERADVAGPALFAVTVSLAVLWRAHGVRPAAVAGQAAGEIAAACVAGALSLPDAAAVVAFRSRSQAEPSGQADRANRELPPALAAITPWTSGISFSSAVTGELTDTARLDGSYWLDNLRGTPRFEQAVRALITAGHRVFIEVSPDPVLAAGLAETIRASGAPAAVTATLHRGQGGLDHFVASLASAWTLGAPTDWDTFYATTSTSTPHRIPLPTYPFQHQPYWRRPAEPAGVVSRAGLTAPDHPLLAAAVKLATGGGMVATARWSLRTHPWLAGHAGPGAVVVPGTALVEAVIRAGAELGCGQIADLTVHAPLVVPRHEQIQVQIAVGAADASGWRPVTLHARPAGDDGGRWTQYATGTLVPPAVVPSDLAAWPPPGAQPVAVDRFYAEMTSRGYDFGPSYQCMRAAWRRNTEIFAEVALPDQAGADADRFGLHPALFDAALQAASLRPDADHSRMLAPFSWQGVCLHATGVTALRVRLTAIGPETVALLLADATGAPVASIESVALRPVTDAT